MSERLLVIHVPVIHRGYLDLFGRVGPNVAGAMVLGDELMRRLRFFEGDISALAAADSRTLLLSLGLFRQVGILEADGIPAIRSRSVSLINDMLSRRFYDQFLPGADVAWETVFLRWDESHVASAVAVHPQRQSGATLDLELMAAAYAEAVQGGDWWRRVGAVLSRDGVIIARAYNCDMPDDQSSYRLGNIRDYLKPGERPELSNTFHAENRIIAEAARQGIKTEGLDLHVTHFPCSMCAKAIVASGIKRCFFGEGSANFDAEMMLRTYGVEIVHVPRAAQ